MASGWWKSTYTNLALGSPVDFAVTTGPKVPRGYPKLASIATGAGLYLGGTPCVVIGSVIYYAGDDYTQDTDKPVICRYDGRASSNVMEIPYITGTTPSKAILSLAVDDNDNIYISTWDSGTTSSDFAGRIFRYANGAIETFGDDVFSSGKLPYALTVFDSKLWVSVIKVDPTKTSSVWSIDLSTETTTHDRNVTFGSLSNPSSVTASRSTTNYLYKLTGYSATSGESGWVPYPGGIPLTNDSTLDATSYNSLSWTAPTLTRITKPQTAPTASSPNMAYGPYLLRYAYVESGSASYHTEFSAAASGNVWANASYNMTIDSAAYSTASNCTHILFVLSSDSGATWVHYPGLLIANNTAGGTYSGTVNISGSHTVTTDTDTTGLYDPSTYRVYRTTGGSTQGLIASTSGLSFVDDGDAGDGSSPPLTGSTNYPASSVNSATDPTTTNTYVVTALNAIGETDGTTVNCTAKATLSSSHAVTISWGAVTGATGYNVYRTAGHSSQGKIVSNTSSTTASDTGLAGSGSAPTQDTSGIPLGNIGCAIKYGNDLYLGMYQTSGTFPTVQKRDINGNWSTADTIAPGGTAADYNGFTAAVVFEENLYMAYWNDDTTDLTLIRKFDGSTWSTVKTISGAGARPIVAFHAHSGTCYAYGGGDAKTGILYSTTDGATWTDISSLLPSSKEAIPFIATTNVLGGF